MGSKRIIEKFEQRFREANKSGVSRLEISFIFTNEPEYVFTSPQWKTFWQQCDKYLGENYTRRHELTKDSQTDLQVFELLQAN
jgi:hypothetical protein